MNPNAENTSGQGRASTIRREIKGWNWGAFLLNFIWAVGNRTWIGLLAVVPLVGYVMPLILGYKGNEWAWKSKRWKSIDHFKRAQKKWAIWGACITGLIIVLLVGFVLFVLSAFRPGEPVIRQHATWVGRPATGETDGTGIVSCPGEKKTSNDITRPEHFPV